MRSFILMASAAALAVPLVPAAEAQSSWSRQNRTSVGYTLRQAGMRAGPDWDYPTIRTIPNNRQVDVFGCLNDWSWCDVGYRSDRGWVAGRLLGADYQGRRRTIVTIAPYLGLLVLSFRFGDYWDNYYRGRPFYSERNRWERHYYDNYRPQWGPRPQSPPMMQGRDRPRSDQQRPRMEQDRRGPGYRDQTVNQPQPSVTPQAVPNPDHRNASPGAMHNRDQSPQVNQPRAATPQATPAQQGNEDSARKRGKSDRPAKNHDNGSHR